MVGGDGPRENRTEAEVLELIYHGDHIRCRLRGARQRRLHRQGAEQPRPTPTLTVGAGTTVGWRTEDCRALDAA